MPHGWKKGLNGFGRKAAAGAHTLTFCRCSSCCHALANAKASCGESGQGPERSAGGKMASRTYLQHAQYIQRQGAKARDNDKLKRMRVRARRATRAQVQDRPLAASKRAAPPQFLWVSGRPASSLNIKWF
jgi:hypothetical protein